MAGTELLYQRNEYWISFSLFLALILVAHGGYLWGKHHRAKGGDKDTSQLSILQSSVLGILALLLGFTFSMAISRYELRVSLVVTEANAIGTTSLRAKMLPDPYRQTAATALRDYVDTRLEIYKATDPLEIVDEEAKERDLQNQLWAAATAAAKQDPHSIPIGLFIATLNDAIDTQAKRDAALRNHVPESALVLLMLVAACAMGMVGFGYGWSDQPRVGQVMIISVVIALVILIIMDLDRPRRGFIRVGQQNMVALAETLHHETP